MLAMADRHGRVWASVPGLANRARVPLEDAKLAIATFLGPDEYSRTPDNEGRRIEPIDGGWRLLNHEKYRSIRDEETTKEAKRTYINKRRAAEREAKSSTVDPVSNTVERSRDNAEADTDTHSVPIGTDASSVEQTKVELWKAGKSLLAEQGMPKAQCGSFVGKLCKDYGDAVVIEAVRATCVARPADAAEYLKALCLHAAGKRKAAEPEWRAEQRERTQQAAPGVAAYQPADQFFLDVKATDVTPRRLG